MDFDENKKPQFVFKFPFRFVKPYKHVYQTHAKQRWLGKNILSTLSKQFLAYSQEYFKQAIKVGKITINNKKVDLSYTIKNSDLLKHQTIRQQPPILDLPIQIIHEDDDFLVVNKPPSMIVHTGGGYHYNTLMAILYYEMGYKNLYILHRIDRLTSGVVILAKKKQKTTKFHEQSMEQVMKKCYYARVSGNVNFDQKIVNVSMICLSHKQGIWSVYDPQTMQDLLITQQIKQSQTKFVKLWYDQKSDSSLLQCSPVTGRTHQIRVHLKHIGHPILNDTVYGGKFVGNCVINQIQQMKQKVQYDKQISDKVQKRVKLSNISYQKQVEDKQKQQFQIDDEWYDKWDYKTRPLQIFLHSFKYRFQGNQYISRKPYWIQKNAVKQIMEQDQKQLYQKQQRAKSNYEVAFLKQSQQKQQISKIKQIKEQQQKAIQNKQPIQQQI